MPFRTIISLLLLAWCCGQAGRAQGEGLRPFRVVCYNVENYFDCVDDSLTDDSEFLPGGIRGWNHARYRLKQAHVARVLAAIAGWDTPALVGLCEVESRKALTDLVRYSPLRSFGYEFIHFDSPDVRGVDVALLYHPYRFFPIRAEARCLNLSNSAAILAYEALRQLDFPGLTGEGEMKGASIV